jgi:hypothetical protein
MSHILLGVKSRTAHLMEMLSSLEKTEKPVLSVCCSSPVRVKKDSTDLECLKCFAKCEVTTVPKASIYNIKSNIIEQLREEDKSLIDAATKMGYTNKIEQPPAPIFKQNILVVDGGVSPKMQQSIEQLPPMEREKLLERLKKEMTTLKEELGEETIN